MDSLVRFGLKAGKKPGPCRQECLAHIGNPRATAVFLHDPFIFPGYSTSS
jgi:hypothetical protein